MPPPHDARMAQLRAVEAAYEHVGFFEVTATILDKNNIDANQTIRDAARRAGVVDFDGLKHGPDHKVELHDVPYIGRGGRAVGDLRFYRTTGRGDERFSVSAAEFRQVATDGSYWAVAFQGGSALLVELDPAGGIPATEGGGTQGRAPVSRPVHAASLEPHVRAGIEGGLARQVEHALVEHLAGWLEAVGFACCRRLYTTEGGDVLESDLVCPGLGLLAEAKAKADRPSIRMAIGQIADYSRFEDPENTAYTAIVLPERPPPDLTTLVLGTGSSLVYQQDGTWVAEGPLAEVFPAGEG